MNPPASTTPPATPPQRIRVIAICVFRQGQNVLVFDGYDAVKRTHFFRPLGGGVEPGETSQAAVAREIKEEMNLEASDLKLLGVRESIFTLDGLPKHEIVFVYDGRFVDETAYTRQELHGREANGAPLHATWLALDSFDENQRLVPDGLQELLRDA